MSLYKKISYNSFLKKYSAIKSRLSLFENENPARKNKSETSSKFNFIERHNKIIVSLQLGTELWCNGSTTDFGSVCPGSNPGSST